MYDGNTFEYVSVVLRGKIIHRKGKISQNLAPKSYGWEVFLWKQEMKKNFLSF